MRTALERNPSLEAARHGLKAAQYELQAVAGASLPQFDATGQVGRAHINGSFLYGPVNAINQTGNRFELGPSLAYNLDVFGGTRRAIESQQAATGVARDQVLNTYVTLVDQVVMTAFDYAATGAQIEVTQSLVNELQSQFDLTHALENAGKITRSDTLLAQTQLENLRATLPALRQQRDAYRNALAQLSGQSPDQFAAPALTLRDFMLPGSCRCRCRRHWCASGPTCWRPRIPCIRLALRSASPPPRACPPSAFPRSTRSRPARSRTSSPARAVSGRPAST